MRYLTFIPLFLLALATPLHALEYEGVYQSEVEVPDQGAQARAAGMRQAMAEVLLKASGTDRVEDNEALAEAMQSASRYVQQYRYRNEDGEGDDKRLMLSIRFDRNGIDGLLRGNGFTVWGAARPTTLVWLAVEQDNSRALVGANDRGYVRARIEAEAARRALPVKLPLLDLTDRSRVRPADVWGEFIDTVEAASARYDSQAILIGRLYSSSSRRWEAKWTLLYQGEVRRWQERSDQVSGLIEQGIGYTAETLVADFTQSLVSGSGSMQLEVLGIENLKQYRRAMGYLSGVHGVRMVRADRVTPDSVRFSLETEGGSQAVLQIIALGDVLESAPSVAVAPLSPPAVEQGSTTASGGETSQSEPPKPPLRVYRLIP